MSFVETLRDSNFSDFREFCVNGFPEIVEWRGSQDDPGKATQTSTSEEPQKQTVQNHGDELPVLNFLENNEEKKRLRMRKKIQSTCDSYEVYEGSS